MATQTETVTTTYGLETLDPVHVNNKTFNVDVQPVLAGRAPDASPSASPPASTHSPVPAQEPPKLSTLHAWILIVQVCGQAIINNLSAGFLMVCIPTMARDVHLSEKLLLWPQSVASLTSGSSMLVMGSISDVLGPRRMRVAGSILTSLLIIATGLARTGPQLITFSALQGMAAAIAGPSGRSMLSTYIEHGRLRNFAFAAIMLAFPIGAGLGLVLGGIYTDTVGWRVGYYSSGACGVVSSIVSIWTLPADHRRHATFREAREKLATEIDWVGLVVASTSFSLLSYVLAAVSTNDRRIDDAYIIALLTISLALIPAFAVWMRHQEKRHKPALIPNSLWNSSGFRSICIMVALSSSAQTALTYFSSLYFQQVQLLSAYQASLRLAPQAAVGGLMCLLVGVFVNKVTPLLAITSTMALCSLSPLLMAIASPDWPYWDCILWAQLLGPVAIDVMFVVGSLVVADAFSGQSQARGFAVFSTFAGLGNAIGLCIMSVISATVIGESKFPNKNAPDALLQGYRASFWAQFAWIMVSCLIGVSGLRGLEVVGKKRD